MKTGTERILTTHTGSLPWPASLADRTDPVAVTAAVQETMRRQRDAGLDIINDGEVGQPGCASCVTERLSGCDGEPGPVGYRDRSKVEADIANLAACSGVTEVFMSAASPGTITGVRPSQYYRGTEEYLFAAAEAMKEEYDAIYQAGLVLQVDCPDLPGAGGDSPAGFRALVSMRLAALDHATRDIPPDRLRLHLCWGNAGGPHHTGVPLADFIDLVLAARPGAISFAGASPRHEHGWKVFEEVALPDGKVIIPGVIDPATSVIEHPELVAQRLIRYAGAVGRANVIAGTDCGFAPFADASTVDPKTAWAKLSALVEGARLASDKLWGTPRRTAAGAGTRHHRTAGGG